MCNFDLGWGGICKAEGEPLCQEHSEFRCIHCGEQATHLCAETMGPCICGCALCPNCEHEIAPDGTNGANFKHCKKSEQKFLPWYLQGEDEYSRLWKEERGIIADAQE